MILYFNFRQEVKEKIKLKQNLLKTLSAENDPFIDQQWKPAGPIISCNGCGKTYSDKAPSKSIGGRPKGLCGFCRYHQKNEFDTKKDRARSRSKSNEILKKMGYVSQKPEDWDQDYIVKFGLLKKASILYTFRRYTDAIVVITKAKGLIDSVEQEKRDKFASLDKKWRSKLQIAEEIPSDLLNYELSQEVIGHFKLKTPLSTLLVYVDKMRKGNSYSIYNRHTYLDNQILQFHKIVKTAIDKFEVDINMIKHKAKDLNDWSTKKDKLREENPKLFKTMSRKYKVEMCPNIKNSGKCKDSYKNCKFAHTPSQLNLTQVDTQKRLLKNNLSVTEKQLKTSKTLVPWKYPRQGIYEQGPKYEKTIKHLDEVANKRSRSAGRSRSIDINRLRINFHEY